MHYPFPIVKEIEDKNRLIFCFDGQTVLSNPLLVDASPKKVDTKRAHTTEKRRACDGHP